MLAFEAEEDHFLLRNADRVEELWASLGDPLKGRLRECMGASLPALLSCFESNDRPGNGSRPSAPSGADVGLLISQSGSNSIGKSQFLPPPLETF